MSPATSTDAFTFEEIGHTYRLGEEVLPSVTQILKSAGIIDYSMIPNDILQQAARRGTYVHKAIHAWLDGELAVQLVPADYLPYIDAARRCIDDLRIEPHRVECRSYHPADRYAGTWDLDGLMAEKDLATVDWKTGMIMPGHAIQLAAYHNMRPNPRAARRLAVQLRSDGSYRVHEYPSPQHPECTYTRDIGIFRSALTCARWNTTNEGARR